MPVVQGVVVGFSGPAGSPEHWPPVVSALGGVPRMAVLDMLPPLILLRHLHLLPPITLSAIYSFDSAFSVQLFIRSFTSPPAILPCPSFPSSTGSRAIRERRSKQHSVLDVKSAFVPSRLVHPRLCVFSFLTNTLSPVPVLFPQRHLLLQLPIRTAPTGLLRLTTYADLRLLQNRP